MHQRTSKKIIIYFLLFFSIGTVNNIELNNKNFLKIKEINTQPGMTKLSLVPEIAAYKGIKFIELIEWILKDASTNK